MYKGGKAANIAKWGTIVYKYSDYVPQTGPKQDNLQPRSQGFSLCCGCASPGNEVGQSKVSTGFRPHRD